MAQDIEDYHNFYLRHTYNYVLNRLFTTMQRSGFTLLQSPFTYPNHILSFIFVPVDLILNHLQEPFRQYYNFHSRLQIQIDHFLQKIQCQIIVSKLTSHFETVQFYQYIHLVRKLQMQMRDSLISKIVNFNLQQNLIQIRFYEMPVLYFLRESYIKTQFNDVKKNVVQLFLINKEHHDQLTTQETIMFQVQHAIHQRDKYFFQARRLQKQLNTFKIKETQRKFQENIQKKGLVELITGQKHKKLDSKHFNNLISKSSQKKKQIQHLIQQRQGDKQYMQNQFGITIYQYTLNEKTFPSQIRDLKSGYKRNKKTLIKKNRSMCICQGITILGMEEEMNKKLEILKQTTYLSSVEFIQCYIRYHLSIHQSTNQHQSKFENVQQNLQANNEQLMHKNFKPLLKLDQQADFKRLARKKCLELGRKQFVNQYNFLKYMRHKVFPYISKYYLEQISGDSNSKNGNTNTKDVTTNTLSKQQELEEIAKKAIYMQDYMIHMGQFLKGNNKPIFHQYPQKIVHILFQLAATFRYLSYFNILHRDIKLNNIMMDKRSYGYQVKLIDWGNSFLNEGHNIKNSNTSNSPSSKHKPTLITTHQYIQTYNQLKKTNRDILQTQFKNCPFRFQTNEYFDIFSYGHIVGNFIEELKGMINSQHWLINKLQYLQDKCLNVNPYHRLSPFQIMVYLHYIIYVLKMKTVSIKNLTRNKQHIIDSVQ